MSEYKGKSAVELSKELVSKQEALRVFRFNLGGKSKNVREGRAIRKDIARIMTEQNATK